MISTDTADHINAIRQLLRELDEGAREERAVLDQIDTELAAVREGIGYRPRERSVKLSCGCRVGVPPNYPGGYESERCVHNNWFIAGSPS